MTRNNEKLLYMHTFYWVNTLLVIVLLAPFWWRVPGLAPMATEPARKYNAIMSTRDQPGLPHQLQV